MQRDSYGEVMLPCRGEKWGGGAGCTEVRLWWGFCRGEGCVGGEMCADVRTLEGKGVWMCREAALGSMECCAEVESCVDREEVGRLCRSDRGCRCQRWRG